MLSQKIKFLEGVTKFEEAVGGYSGAQKFLFEKNEKKYFIKIGKFEVRDDLEELFSWADIPHPKVVESGTYDEENNYIIEEFADGTPLKFKLDDFAPKFVYEFGFRIGERYRNLRKKFPDKPVSDETYANYMKQVDKYLERLAISVRENKDKLSESQKVFLDYIKNFLNNKRKLVKESVMVFGHTDVKPSNFLISEREINVIDFEHTDYKELSLSLLWSFARADFKDEKNYSFANGYLDGLFNFYVPKNFLKCCNYTYLFNMCKYCCDYIENGEFDKLDKLMNYIQLNFMKNGKIQVDKNLLKVAKVEDFSMLKDFEITYMKGSYSPDNLTFKCENGDKKYFLKIMQTNKRNLQHCLDLYELMQHLNIPISPVRTYGSCCDNRFFIINDFIEYPEMDLHANSLTFEEGVRLGQLVAKELKKLKGHKAAGVRTFDKNDLSKTLTCDVEFVFGESEKCPFIDMKKCDALSIIYKLIKSFDDEKLVLIHGDVKFGNILFDGKDKVVFVDNESLMCSYDIINFLYNILSGFEGSKVLLYQGFVNGYLKFMNDGQIPQRIQGQAKLLIFARLLRDVKAILNKTGSDKRIKLLNELCQKYIVCDEGIVWLK